MLADRLVRLQFEPDDLARKRAVAMLRGRDFYVTRHREPCVFLHAIVNSAQNTRTAFGLLLAIDAPLTLSEILHTRMQTWFGRTPMAYRKRGRSATLRNEFMTRP